MLSQNHFTLHHLISELTPLHFPLKAQTLTELYITIKKGGFSLFKEKPQVIFKEGENKPKKRV